MFLVGVVWSGFAFTNLVGLYAPFFLVVRATTVGTVVVCVIILVIMLWMSRESFNTRREIRKLYVSAGKKRRRGVLRKITAGRKIAPGSR